MIQKTFPSTPDTNTPEGPILEHGLDLIFRDGVKGFTVETLAKDLAMSKKTIYKFFPSKEVLLGKIFQYITTIIAAKFQSILSLDINPLDKFETAINEIVKTINRVSISKVGELKVRYPHIWREIEEFRLARREDFLTIFKEAQDQGYVRQNIDLELTSIIFMQIINDVFQPEFFIKNDIGVKDTLLTYREFFLRGIVTEKGLKHIEGKI
ncbi:MAG: TetR/AcrR family transcriptional regulator [Candidatus Marinimicrobia bacterium]|jgi:TetR/AcrR family transcriptional regulator, cholesterol catabolism regulator|nr:TetR/AcrR family transcriptional regulator [Candidatus Neomarinimicrobiota bacterium]MBT4362252.1 TetR/AcrR family transcriptional regulator [Candidatus Neomarinimicrobiota bacterium]MBT4716163.1 TetR/AcrR family transcriptional regulator [Candidatus Neomarinimicrobiota bacterium]MBT4947649.1 TetR/AcrR family transcriptional regulator [Candidatus Neomarinimicrobiota bacterium]MBT5271200.1 TetR/AcrR family transcriptional regulator [Candidatus Neomarinimicrobiota bacterium]